MQHVWYQHQPHLALAYYSLAKCTREWLLSTVCHSAVEKQPALPFAAHAYKARHDVQLPAGSHAHHQHNTNYD